MFQPCNERRNTSSGPEADTHRGEKFKENHENVTGKYRQEIHRGFFNDRVEKALHTADTHTTSISRRIYDDEEDRDVFNERVGRCINVPY